jgi:hypothetical protein
MRIFNTSRTKVLLVAWTNAEPRRGSAEVHFYTRAPPQLDVQAIDTQADIGPDVGADEVADME